MQTKESILAMRTIKAIGATMPILEIMLMKASPLAVETKVFLQAQVSLLVFQASCQKVLATRATFNLSYYSGKLIEFHQVEELERTIYHWTVPKSLRIKKAVEKPQCQLTMPKLLASTKIVSLTVPFHPLEGTSNSDQTRLK